MTRVSRGLSLITFAAMLAAAAPALAVDGVILIDQNRALAGNVTPGDAPGFPVSINSNGSFRLSGNLTVPDVNTTAIAISNVVDNVTIDLNGFSIIGPVSCVLDINAPGSPTVCDSAAPGPNDIFGEGTGIRSAAQESVTIKNGTVRGMGRYGIFIASAPYAILENIHARENGRGGLWPGIGLVLNSMVSNNGNFGVQMNQGLVKGTIIARNVGSGIVSTGLTINVQDSQINDNGQFGIDFTSAGGAIGNNVIRGNDAGAIDGSPIETTENYCSGAGCIP